jgi:glycosyltransferase involved in cell wall biosynthesis
MNTPRVTIGIPVYNGEETIEKAIRSALDQTFEDLEVIVSDNQSTDRTGEIVSAIAAVDSRVRYHRNPEPLPQNANFSQAAKLARGEWFRWVGDDDWLEQKYVERCLEAVAQDPEAIAVTTYQKHVEPDGTEHYEEWTGARPTQPTPVERLGVMLDLLRGNPFWIDPVYTFVKTESLRSTGLVKEGLRFADLLISCEMAMAGPWAHVPEFLCSRTYVPLPQGWKAYAQYTGRSAKTPGAIITANTQRVLFAWHVMRSVVGKRGWSPADKVRGVAAAVRYYFGTRTDQVKRRLNRIRSSR